MANKSNTSVNINISVLVHHRSHLLFWKQLVCTQSRGSSFLQDCFVHIVSLLISHMWKNYMQLHWSSVKELFPSPHTLFWSRHHHFLFKPFLSKSFSVYMWIQCLTFIYTHCSFKSSLNFTFMKNYSYYSGYS